MIRNKFFTALAFIALSFVAISSTFAPTFAPAVLAADFQGGNRQQNVEVPATTASRNLYTAAMHVTVDGSTTKDLTAAGQTVIINGAVGDDLMAAGQNLNIKGTIGGSVRVAGSQVDISSPTVGEDLLVAGSNVDIESTTTIKGDLIVGAGTLVVNGNVDGNVKFTGGRVTINGKVNGNINAQVTDTLELGPLAVVTGNIYYTAPQELIQDQGSAVTGQINFTQRQEHSSFFPALTIYLLLKLLAAILAAFVIFWLARRRFTAVVFRIGNGFWSNAGVGLAGLIVIPFVTVALLFILIGYYVAFMLLAWYFLALMLSMLIGSVYFGSWLIAKIDKKEMKVDYLTIIVGVVVVGVLHYIPIVGWLFMAVLLCAGFGTLLKYINQERKI